MWPCIVKNSCDHASWQIHVTVHRDKFMWPCIVTNSCDRASWQIHVTCIVTNFLIINQLDALISQIYFERKLYMFRTVPLSIIRSFLLYTQQWYMSYRFADSLRAGSACSILILLASCHQTCTTYTITACAVKTPDDGQRDCPKHVDFHSKNKIEKLVHLVQTEGRSL